MAYSYATGWFMFSYTQLEVVTFTVYPQILRHRRQTVSITGQIPLLLSGKSSSILEYHTKSKK
jgi:hypothetical protein